MNGPDLGGDNPIGKELIKAIGKLAGAMIMEEAERLAELTMHAARGGYNVAYSAIGIDPDAEEQTEDMSASEPMKVMIVVIATSAPLAVLQDIAHLVQGIAQDAENDAGVTPVVNAKNDKGGRLNLDDPTNETK